MTTCKASQHKKSTNKNEKQKRITERKKNKNN